MRDTGNTGDAAWQEYRRDVERVLGLARRHLEMDVAWMSEFEGGEQVFLAVDNGESRSDPTGIGPQEGTSAPLKDSYCLRVVDGRLPHAVPDTQSHPVTRELPGTSASGIGSYVGVPISTENEVVGMLCCAGRSARTDLGEQEVSTLAMLAALLGDLLARSSTRARRRNALHDRVRRAVSGDGLNIVLQPIIATRSGRLVGAEALARFTTAGPGSADQGPAAWFADAEYVGLRPDLEATAARLALARLGDLRDTARLTVNISPDLVVAGALDPLLAGIDVSRVVLELTEHAPVPDYGELHRALSHHRHAGLRLAIDDAGAGYASFRHILNLRPDLIKMDMSLVSRIDLDPAQQALVGSLLSFAESSGAVLLAEGVETQAELNELDRLGVPLVQGFLLARPSSPPLPARYPMPSAVVPA